MFNPLLPQRADNTFRGHTAAPVLFAVLLLVKTGISLGSMLNGRMAATSADGIPLDTYGLAGAQTVLSLFALLGFANLIVCAIGVVVLVRYRSLVPFMFALNLVQQLGRQLILLALPIVRVGAPPGSAINLAMLATMIVGLALSLWSRDRA
jgi:hypothetical protein